MLPNSQNDVEGNISDDIRRLIAIDNFLSLLYTARDVIYQSRSIPAIKETKSGNSSGGNYDVEDEIPY